MDVLDVEVFLSTVAAGGLSAGARRLKISPMAATRRLAALEADLRVRLLHRTTRSISLTAEGEAFLPFAERILQAAEQGKAKVTPDVDRVQGRLRITSCGAIGRTVVVPVVAGLLRDNPGLHIDLMITDTMVDVVSAGVDVAVRIGELRSSTLTGRVVGKHPRGLYAAPSYLAVRGVPSCIADLAAHDCILLSGQRHWSLVLKSGERQVSVSGRITTNSVEGNYDACLEGAGLAMLSRWRAEPDVAAGRLIAVPLSDGQPKEHDIHALFPSRRQLPPKVKLFVSALKAGIDRRLTISQSNDLREYPSGVVRKAHAGRRRIGAPGKS